MYGQVEIQLYQITPLGAERINSGQLGAIGQTEKEVLASLAKLGGTAEVDELKTFGNLRSPMTLNVALRNLIDMGYVLPVTSEPQQPQQQGVQ